MIKDFEKFMGMETYPVRSVDVVFFNWPSLFVWAALTGALMYIYGWHFIFYGLVYRIFINANEQMV